jgi:biotin operon repressor
MLYQRSLDIEQRLQDVLDLIRAGNSSSPKIAELMGVSIPTVSRDVTALRERGYNIRSERMGGIWRYVLGDDPTHLSRASFSLSVGPRQ